MTAACIVIMLCVVVESLIRLYKYGIVPKGYDDAAADSIILYDIVYRYCRLYSIVYVHGVTLCL